MTGWNQSTAVAIIGRSAPHYHRKITETYIIEEGSLILTVDNMTLNLNPGDAVIIHPGQIHSAEGTPARVRVVASPAWTPEDHILV